MSSVTLARPWLHFDLGQPMQVLSWAINRPGFVTADRILWREVRNVDLPVDLDVDAWLADELAAHGALDAVTFLTSRGLQHFNDAHACVGEVEAHAVATVGFSNAERVGHRVDRSGAHWGTINVAVRLNIGLTQAALLEAMSIAVEARTAAVIDVGHKTPKGISTGTGTDCVAVASPEGAVRYAGLHTEIGEAVGRAVYDAVHQGAENWVTSMKETGHAAT
ncbi:MAG: adenosylcobinamide amidohydrolase [Pseudomonadota bacterium]